MRGIIDRRGFLSILIGLILLGFLFGLFHYTTQQRNIMLIERQIAVIKQSLTAYKEEELSSAIETLDKEKVALEGCAEDFYRSLPEDMSVPRIVLLLSDLCSETVQKRSLVFLEQESTEDYVRFPVRFTFRTDYTGLKKLLLALDALPILVSVDNMQVSLIENPLINSLDSSNTLLYNVHVVMTLHFYTVAAKG